MTGEDIFIVVQDKRSVTVVAKAYNDAIINLGAWTGR